MSAPSSSTAAATYGGVKPRSPRPGYPVHDAERCPGPALRSSTSTVSAPRRPARPLDSSAQYTCPHTPTAARAAGVAMSPRRVSISSAMRDDVSPHRTGVIDAYPASDSAPYPEPARYPNAGTVSPFPKQRWSPDAAGRPTSSPPGPDPQPRSAWNQAADPASTRVQQSPCPRRLSGSAPRRETLPPRRNPARAKSAHQTTNISRYPLRAHFIHLPGRSAVNGSYSNAATCTRTVRRRKRAQDRRSAMDGHELELSTGPSDACIRTRSPARPWARLSNRLTIPAII